MQNPIKNYQYRGLIWILKTIALVGLIVSLKNDNLLQTLLFILILGIFEVVIPILLKKNMEVE